MRKHLLLSLALLFSILGGAFAQNGPWTIQDKATNKYLTNGQSFGKWDSSVGFGDTQSTWAITETETEGQYKIIETGVTNKYLGEGNGGDAEYAFNDLASVQKFQFFSDGDGGYYLYNVTRSKWAYKDSDNKLRFSNTESDRTAFTLPEGVDLKTTISFNYIYKFGDIRKNVAVAGLSGHPMPELPWTPFCLTGSKPDGVIVADQQDMEIELSLSVESYPIVYADSYDNISQWYKVRMHSNNPVYMYSNGSSISFSSSCPVKYSDYLWAFVGDPLNGFTLYNYTAGKEVAVDNQTPSGLSTAGTAIKWMTNPGVTGQHSASADAFFIMFLVKGSYLNYNNSGLNRYQNPDNGSTFMINAADIPADDAEFQVAKTNALALANSSSVLYGDPNIQGTPAYNAISNIEEVTHNGTQSSIENAVASINNIVRSLYASVTNKKITLESSNATGKYFTIVDAIQLAANTKNNTSEFIVNYASGTDGEFTIQSSANGRYIAPTPADNGGNGGRIQMSTSPSNYKIVSAGVNNKVAFVCVNPVNASHNALHRAGSNNIVAWSSTDANGFIASSCWIIAESNLSGEPLIDGMNTVRNQASTLVKNFKNNNPITNENIGQGLGKYSPTTEFITVSENIENTPGEWNFEEIMEFKNTYSSNLNQLGSINLPEAGKFYTFRGKQSTKYLGIKNDGSYGEVADNSASTIWYVTKNGDKYNLLSYKNGQYSNGQSIAAIGSNGMDYTITNAIAENGSKLIGEYGLMNPDGYFACSWGNGSIQGISNKIKKNDWSGWILEEVTDLPISIAISGYTTMYSPVSLTLPEELEAYTASVNEQTAVVTYTKVSGVPANTGVLLYRISGKSESETPHNLGTGDTTEQGNSDLKGKAYTQTYSSGANTVAGEPLDAYVYTLQSGKFKWYTGTKLTGFKAHLELKDGRETGNARTYTFTFDDNTPTGITEIDGMIESNATIYDLSGRKMTHLQKGINIVNGKKVIR